MTGNIYRGQAGLPFSSALRIYEPLEAFPEVQQEALRAAGGGRSRAAVENAELMASLGRITRPDGDPFPTGRTDLVRVVPAPARQAPAGTGPDSTGYDAAKSGAESGTETGPGAAAQQADRLLYCPSQLVLRAGLAANALIEGIHGPLAELLIPEEQRDKAPGADRRDAGA
jgi:hypothetical protein